MNMCGEGDCCMHSPSARLLSTAGQPPCTIWVSGSVAATSHSSLLTPGYAAFPVVPQPPQIHSALRTGCLSAQAPSPPSAAAHSLPQQRRMPYTVRGLQQPTVPGRQAPHGPARQRRGLWLEPPAAAIPARRMAAPAAPATAAAVPAAAPWCFLRAPPAAAATTITTSC